MTARLPPNSIRLYHRGTPAGHDLYPVVINERFSRTQNAPWPRRVVTGPVGADAEEFISSWTQDDYSGGFGILDANESTDTSRIAFGVIDGRRPKSMCLQPETVEITSPTWAETGAFYPLGDIGTQFYGAWANGIAGWNHAAGTPAWHTTQNAWPASFVLLGKPVMFCGGLFCPGGAQGFVRLSEATPATGTLTVTPLTTIHAVQFGLHDGCLWAIDTANNLWQLTTVGAAAGATTITNWGSATDAGVFPGTAMKDAFGNLFTLDTSLTPTQLIEYPRADGEQALWVITRAQGAYLLNPDEPRWIKSSVRAGAHPDWGIAADVFRDGEDLFIAAGGLDVTRFTTANVEVPLSGPSKDQGVPPEYQGTIQDLNSERSTLYALVKAGTGLAAGAPASTWVLQSTETTYNGIALSNPGQVAVGTDGKVYIADTGNNRVVKLDSDGTYLASHALVDVIGVAVDASGNVYASTFDIGVGAVAKFDPTLATLLWGGGGIAGHFLHVATDGTHVYLTAYDHKVYKLLCSTGATVTSWGTLGSGDTNYHSPYGIAVGGGEVYVSDFINNRIKVTNTTGTYVRQWANTGAPLGVALDASGDVWVCEAANNQLTRTSNTGVAQTTIAQSSPQGIGVTSGDILWVSTGTGTLVAWDEEVVSSEAIVSMNWLGAWTGTAWCALWESAVSMTPTWMRIAMKGDYALWWGNTDGVAYRQLLPPPFFNPAARVTLGVYPFAPTGWMETVRFDAQMGGWDKVAAHLFAMLDYAAADTYVDISYRTDADQFTSGLLYPPYRPWKRVDHIGRTLCRFDDAEVDPISGGTWQEGECFQWIQFRYDFVRGDDRYKSPIWLWHSMHFVPVPQDAATFALKIPTSFERSVYNRSPNEMTQTLRGLGVTRPFLHLQIGNSRPSQPDWQTFFRVKVTQVKSEFVTGADNNLDEVISLSLVEIGESSNLHTTLAVDIP
jgi:hypothetical protein